MQISYQLQSQEAEEDEVSSRDSSKRDLSGQDPGDLDHPSGVIQKHAPHVDSLS